MSHYMEKALELAKHGQNSVSPNPMVGCVIVKNNTIVGQGYHQRAGEPHAEIFALRDAKESARGADVYVTLEPCCHYGRTPPCTSALIQAGVKRVFIACQDPNPLIASKGIQVLNAAGIETIVGIKEAEAQQLNKVFFHFIQHKTPFVIAKWAMSLDGKTITNTKDDRIISDEACHAHAHQTRQIVDAIVIGSKTALLDNPKLTARASHSIKSIKSIESIESIEKQPRRIVLSSHGSLPLDLALFSYDLPGKTIVATTDAIDDSWRKQAEHKNIELWILPQNKHQQVDLHALLKKCGKENITSLLVEGGETVHQSFMQASLVQEFNVYLSPIWIGHEEKKKFLAPLHCQSLGASLFIQSGEKIV